MAGERPLKIDFAAEGLLDGLEGEQRADRLALLEYLAGEGASLAELRRQSENGTVVFAAADRVITGGERLTAAQVAELTGVEPEFLETVRRAQGLPVAEPDEAVYSDAEVEAARMIHLGREAGISDEDTVELSRVLGRGLSPAAEALRALPFKAVVKPGISELELARSYAEAVSQMYPLVNPLVASVLLLHLRTGTQAEVMNALERSGGRLPGSREVAVCFADLVGFTRLGELVPPEDLSSLAARLEVMAGDVVQPPVKLVKSIGDAVMLASPEPEPLLDAGLSLLDAADAEGEDFPQLRVGSALGRALSRAGDWFGRPVNLASRVTQIARPGSLLAEREVREAVPDTFRWSYAGERRIKGVSEAVPLFRARRLETDG
jgi:adenylate cyclase